MNEKPIIATEKDLRRFSAIQASKNSLAVLPTAIGDPIRPVSIGFFQQLLRSSVHKPMSPLYVVRSVLMFTLNATISLAARKAPCAVIAMATR